MTLARRVIVCLDVAGDRVVKGVQFANLRDVGDPAALAARYEADGADEIVFLDVAASVERRDTLLDCVRRTAEGLFIPLTVGGGIRSVSDAACALRAGADKVGVNSASVERPELLTDLADRFGAQCVVASIDAARRGEVWEVFIRGGSTPTGLDAVEWARRCVELGAGEILLTSVDRDGMRVGYDLELTRAIASTVNVPVIASGGAGSAADVVQAIKTGGADAVLVAGIVHDGTITVRAIKQALTQERIQVRAA